jgi:uncharacterized membrane protein YhaH (DUF805 family)
MKEAILLIVGIIVLVSTIAAGLIAKRIHDSLMHSGNKNYIGLSVLSFIASFFGIGFLLYLVVYAFFSN